MLTTSQRPSCVLARDCAVDSYLSTRAPFKQLPIPTVHSNLIGQFKMDSFRRTIVSRSSSYLESIMRRWPVPLSNSECPSLALYKRLLNLKVSACQGPIACVVAVVQCSM